MRKLLLLILFLISTTQTKESQAPADNLPMDIFWVGRFTCEQYDTGWIAYDSAHVSQPNQRAIKAIYEVITMSN